MDFRSILVASLTLEQMAFFSFIFPLRSLSLDIAGSMLISLRSLFQSKDSMASLALPSPNGWYCPYKWTADVSFSFHSCSST